jgi:hypothetical protein
MFNIPTGCAFPQILSLHLYVIIWTIYVTLFLIIKEKDAEILKLSSAMQLQEIHTIGQCINVNDYGIVL